jgi:adenylate cyclase
LSLVVVALLVSIAFILVGFNFHQGRLAALSAARQEMRILSDRILDRYRSVFGGAAALVDLASASDIVRRPQVEDQATLGRFLQHMLSSSDSIDSAYAGYPSGRFVQAVSIVNDPSWALALSAPPGAALATRIISVDDQGQRLSRWEFLDGDGNWLATTELQPADYDPRQRPWYREATAASGLVATGPYRMWTTGAQGITLARRHAAYGSIVIGVDVLLSRIDAFLSTQKITPGSSVFIFDAGSRLIATSDQGTPGVAGCDGDCARQGLLTQRLATLAASMPTADSSSRTLRVDHRDYLMVAAPISSTPLLEGGHIVAVAPLKELTAASDLLLDESLAISAAVLALGVAVAFLIAKAISVSLARIAAQAERLRRFEPLSGAAPIGSRISEIAKLAAAMSDARSAILAFGLYVPKELVRRIFEAHEFTGRGGKRQLVTALFSDIQDFTTISEKNTAEEVVSLLSDYFDLFSEAVQRHNGVIIQFSGDAVFALWNAPQADELHVDHACECALALEARVAEFNARQSRRRAPVLVTRFGIHTGIAVVGSVGAKDRIQYTAMGDAVNVASRLEGLNKERGTTILVSAAVVAGARRSFHFQRLGLQQLRGRAEPVEVFALSGKGEIDQPHGADHAQHTLMAAAPPITPVR